MTACVVLRSSPRLLLLLLLLLLGGGGFRGGGECGDGGADSGPAGRGCQHRALQAGFHQSRAVGSVAMVAVAIAIGVTLMADKEGRGIVGGGAEIRLSKDSAVSGLGRVDVSSWSLAGLGTPFLLDWRGRKGRETAAPGLAG